MPFTPYEGKIVERPEPSSGGFTPYSGPVIRENTSTFEGFEKGFSDDPENQKPSVTPEQEEAVRRDNRSGFGVTDDPSLVELAAGGIAGGIKNIGVTAASVGDTIMSPIRESLTGTPNRAAETLQRNIPEYKTSGKSFLEDMVVEGAEWLPGMYAGGRTAMAVIPEAAGVIGKGLRLLGIGVGSDIGGAMLSADPETERLVISGKDKSLLEELTGFGIDGWMVDENDEFNEALWKEKANLLGDTLITTGLMGGVTVPLTAGANFLRNYVVYGLKGLSVMPGSEAFQEKKIVEDILRIIGSVSPDDTPSAQAQKMKLARNLIANNKDIVMKFSEVDPRLSDQEFQTDVLSTLINQLDPKTDGQRIAELERIRSTSLSSNSPKLEEATDRPARAVEDSLQDVYQTRGESSNIDTARDTAILEAEGRPGGISEIRTDISVNEVAREAAQRSLDQSLREDPTFGPLLEELGGRVNIDFLDPYQKQGEELIEKVARASDLMTSEKNEAFRAIGNADLDLDELSAFMMTEGQALPPEIKKLLGYEEVVDELGGVENLVGDVDFSTMNETVLPKIHAYLSRLTSDPNSVSRNYQQIDALKSLRNHINEYQLDFISENGAPEVQEAAEHARQVYHDYAKYWRQGPLEEIQHLVRSPGDLSVEDARVVLEKGMTDVSRPRSVGRIVDVFRRDEGGQSSEAVEKWGLLKILSSLQREINKGTIVDDAVLSEFGNALNEVTPLLKSVNPERVGEINTFLNTLRSGGTDVKNIDAELERLKEALKLEEEDVYGYLFKEFYQKTPKGRELIPTTYEQFTKMFDSPENLGRVRQIKELVQNDPVALDGLQAAYAKFLKEKSLLTPYKSASKVKKVDVAEMSEFLDPDSSLYQYTTEVMGEGYSEIIRQTVQRAFDIGSTTNIKRGVGVDTEGFAARGSQQITNMITWVFGILNPTAARIRTVTGQLQKGMTTTDRAKIILDTVLSEPETFIEIADRVLAEGAAGLSPADKRMIFYAFVRGGIYSQTDENAILDYDVREIDQETDDMMDDGILLDPKKRKPISGSGNSPVGSGKKVIDLEEWLR